MNKLKVMALLAAFFSASLSYAQTAAKAPTAAEPATLNAVVAVVNNDVITTNELTERVHSVALNLRRQNIQLPPMPQLRAQVLEQLILERAVAQRAHETGIRVDDNLVNVTIEQIAAQNKISVTELRRRLSLDGVPFNQFREEIRSQIMTQRLREREVDAQIREAVLSLGIDYMQGYLIGKPQPLIDTLNETRELAEDILSRAEKGEDFGQLAASYSRMSNALEGGAIGWRTLSQLPSTLASAVLDAQRAESHVAMSVSSDGFSIVKVNGTRDGVQTKLAGGPVTQTHARHILMAVTPVTDEATVLSRMNDIYNRLVNNHEDFATLARLHSVDGSATRGGDLGWLQPGDTVPAFEDAMNKLQPGEISKPVKSEYGYHIIQVLDRRQESANAERMRHIARQTLRQRKLAEAVATWQRELRDKAYVEIRRDELY